jgi:DNA mismatch repair protein MutS
VERYIAKLLEAGYKVAICEQLEEPSPKKRLVRRDVTRVLTPGTLVEDSFLDAKRYNFLVALCGGTEDEKRHEAGRGAGDEEREGKPKRFGFAVAEVSTGEFAVTELDGKTLWDELTRLQPAEVLLPERLADDELSSTVSKASAKGRRSPPLTLTPSPNPNGFCANTFRSPP